MPIFARLRSWSRSGRGKDSDQPRSESRARSRSTVNSNSRKGSMSPPGSCDSYSLAPCMIRSRSVSESRLPMELEKRVFEWAARAHPETMPKMMLSCRRVHKWIEPILYELVTLYHPHTADKFIYTIDSKPPGWFSTRVKTLCLTNLVPREQASFILGACDGAQNLACWIRQALSVPNMEFLQPVRFSMTALGMWNDCSTPPPGPDFDSPLFQKVTHLDLTDNWELWRHWTKFNSLPKLTHLELRLGSENDFKKVRQPIRAILSSCKKLEVLVLLVTYQPGCILGLTAIGDPRCVVLRQANLTENWEAPSRGKADRWVQAEAAVRAQRRAISKPTSTTQSH